MYDGFADSLFQSRELATPVSANAQKAVDDAKEKELQKDAQDTRNRGTTKKEAAAAVSQCTKPGYARWKIVDNKDPPEGCRIMEYLDKTEVGEYVCGNERDVSSV